MPVKVVLSTIDDAEAAQKLAIQLVEEELAACVNIIPNISSIYKWEGTLEKSQEYLLLMKTTADLVSALIRRINKLHPYDVPEILSIDVTEGHPPYLQWVAEQTR